MIIPMAANKVVVQATPTTRRGIMKYTVQFCSAPSSFAVRWIVRNTTSIQNLYYAWKVPKDTSHNYPNGPAVDKTDYLSWRLKLLDGMLRWDTWNHSNDMKVSGGISPATVENTSTPSGPSHANTAFDDLHTHASTRAILQGVPSPSHPNQKASSRTWGLSHLPTKDWALA